MKRLFLYFLLLTSLSATAQDDKNHDFDVSKNIDIFNTIYRNLDMLYVDTLNADEVIGTGIDAMMRSLDPYTEYYPEDKTQELKQALTGKYAGVGALIRFNQQINNVVIDEPYANMPAAEAGLKKGDVIISIDDTLMKGKDVSYVSNHLRGDAGTSFIAKILRPTTGKITKIKVTRRAIQLPSMPYYGMLKQNVGYINLNSFTENCARDVKLAFVDLKRQGAKGLIFDLRNNGGGLLSEAVSIVNMFVPKGLLLVQTKGKLQRYNKDYRTTSEPIDTVMPIIVLVNGNTASASEITSGSLQDLDRAVVLGTRTYGKGLVQMPMDLPYNGTMKLTTSKYYIPSGRCIQAINYKHANGGYKEHVPDSLTKVFYTANGREVRDGGGIKPDVEVIPDSLPNIAYYLAGIRDSNEVLLNYEVDYISKHSTIDTPEKFVLSDADYEKFKQCVIKSNFKYDGQSEKMLEDLVKVARFEGYYDDAKPEFDALKSKLLHNVSRDLDINKRFIKSLIEDDIVAAYYYQAGSIQHGLQTDKQVEKAIELLNNNKEYKIIIQPVKK
nr:S41 family peptidase [Prevotella sp.]